MIGWDMRKSTSPGARDRDRRGSHEQVQSIARGLAVLAWLNRFGAGTSGQLAKALGLKRSTAHRILGVLVDLNLVSHDRLSHQYLLSAGALELSSGFHDEDWVTRIAEPRMSDWTLRQHWPLLLVTPVSDDLVVRVSTDYLSSIAGDRFVTGQVMPIRGSVAGALHVAWQRRGTKADTARDAGIREQGYAARRTGVDSGPRLAVPMVIDRRYFGSLALRCLPETIDSQQQLEHWVLTLRSLAEGILRDAAPLLLR
jgi:IclR family mhp operon transcriptional activator